MSSERMVDRHGLEILSMRQCLDLVRQSPVGRVAFMAEGAPVVLPVNHMVVGNQIVFRSALGHTLDAAERHRPVAFEVDDFDTETRSGWSVVVRGRIETIDEELTAASLEEQGLDSWAPDVSDWVRIVADEITGRRLSGHA